MGAVANAVYAGKSVHAIAAVHHNAPLCRKRHIHPAQHRIRHQPHRPYRQPDTHRLAPCYRQAPVLLTNRLRAMMDRYAALCENTLQLAADLSRRFAEQSLLRVQQVDLNIARI
ncbi:hypothetical protein D3C84_972740 [compost metagenome]